MHYQVAGLGFGSTFRPGLSGLGGLSSDMMTEAKNRQSACDRAITWECRYVPFARVLSTSCREEQDLYNACVAGYFQPPPMPVPPSVPPGGYTGPAGCTYDDNGFLDCSGVGASGGPGGVVDSVIAETKRRQDEVNRQTIGAPGNSEPDPVAGPTGKTDYTLYLVAGFLALALVIRR